MTHARTKTSNERAAEVALVLAKISSNTRVRLNRRGVAVDPPAEHAERLVRFFTRIADEPYCASPEHSERILNEFASKYVHLTQATYEPKPLLTTPNGTRVFVELVHS